MALNRRKLRQGLAVLAAVAICAVLYTLLGDYVRAPKVATETESAFGWEGELNPNDFDDDTKWEYIGTLPAGGMYVWVIIHNLDKNSDIEALALLVNIEQDVLLYRYFKDGEVFAYRFNSGKNAYEKYEYSEEQKAECMQCHEGRLTKKTSI